MTTNVEQLPLLQAAYGTGSDEDFYLPLTFVLADGVTPVSVAGITFTAQLGYVGSLATLSSGSGITVVGGNSILLFVPAASGPIAWAVSPGPGTYTMSLVASDGTNTRDIFQLSQYQLGVPVPPYVTVVSASGGPVSNPLLDISMEAITIATLNIFPPLSQLYAPGGFFMLIINGRVFTPVGSSPPFSVSGNQITWLSTTYSVTPGSSVVAIYEFKP